MKVWLFPTLGEGVYWQRTLPFVRPLGSRLISWNVARHPVEEAFRGQLALPCLCSQTVFPFIPARLSLFILVLFYTVGPHLSWKTKTCLRLPV